MSHEQSASPCAECGYDYEPLGQAQILSAVASLAAEHRLVLSSVPAGRLRAHTRPATWSVLEYGCHVRDVLRTQRERVTQAQARPTPSFALMRRDERAVEERYNDQDPLVVADDLATAARLFIEVLKALDDQGWQRTGIYPWPVAEARTVAWIARWTAHELAHHLFDGRRLLSSASLAPGRDLAAAIGPPGQFAGYDPQQAALFAAAWLPAWTGNRPRELVSFYTTDTFYSDPQIPDGVHGREALTQYLTGLLARAPDWVWTQTASTPMLGGFVNYWLAQVPLGGTELRLTGVCLVELRDGLIARNQVFFDRVPLRDAVRARRAEAGGTG